MRCSLNQASGFASVSSERRLSASHTPAYTRGVDGEGRGGSRGRGEEVGSDGMHVVT